MRQLFLNLAILLGMATVLGIAIGHLLPSAYSPRLEASALPSGWRPVDWPYLKDQFPPGVSLNCMGPGCPSLLEVTLRTKIGFCNCVTGVADDEELARIGDTEALGGAYTPDRPGEAIALAGMKGRERLYSKAGDSPVLSMAYSRGCDAIAVVARGLNDDDGKQHLRALLESRAIAAWLAASLEPR